MIHLKCFFWSLVAVVAGGLLFNSVNLYGQRSWVVPINNLIYDFDDVYSVVSRLEGKYIPADLEDAIKMLDKELDAKEKIRLRDSSDFFDQHFGLGMWIRNNWGLWSGSRLKKYFLQHGYWDADYISGVIVGEYLEYLKGKPYRTTLEGEAVVEPKYWNDSYNDAFISKLEKNRKEMLEAGFGYGKKVRFVFPYGYSSKDEARSYKNGGNVIAPEGLIKDVDYLNKRILVEVRGSYSPEGLIIYDGNLKGKPGRVYVKRNLEDGSEDMESIVFMQKGDRIWFHLGTGHWEGIL